MSININYAFNQTKLNKLMKAAKKEYFVYGVDIGFANGYMLLSDNKQVKHFIQNEFMFSQDLFSCHGENKPELKTILIDTKADFEKNCLIHASITPFLHQDACDFSNKRLCRVFKCDKGNFIIDTKFLNVLRNQFVETFIYSTDDKMQKLLIRTYTGEFVAGIIGIRSKDEQRELFNSVDGMEV